MNVYIVLALVVLAAGMQDTALKAICATIREVGKARNLTVIDVHFTTSNCASAFYKDGVHPNNDGARMIAEKICAILSENNKQEEG